MNTMIPIRSVTLLSCLAWVALSAISPVAGSQAWLSPKPWNYEVTSSLAEGTALIAADRSGRVLFTNDLLSWDEYSAGVSGEDQDLVYFNGCYILKGGGGVIGVSRTGQAWAKIAVFDRWEVEHVGFVRDGSDLHLLGYIDSVGQCISVKTTDGVNWSASQLAPPAGTRAVVRFGSEWVSVGIPNGIGAIFTSADGIDWIPRVSNIRHPLRDVAAVGDRLVAIGGSFREPEGIVLSSVDGREWTESTTHFAWRINAILVHGGRVMICDVDGSVFWSEDLLHWEQHRVVDGGELVSLAHFAGRFVAFGLMGRMYTSEDGATWDRVSEGPVDGVFSFIEVDGVLNAYGCADDEGRAVVLRRSVTGEWNAEVLSSPAPLRGVTKVADHFVALGREPFSAGLLVSANGHEWTEAHSFSGGFTLPGFRLRAAWNGIRVCVVTDDYRVLVSENFLDWEEVYRPGGSVPGERRTFLKDVIAHDGRLLAGGYVEDEFWGSKATIFESADGVEWTPLFTFEDELGENRGLGGFLVIQATRAGVLGATASGTLFLDDGSGWKMVYESARQGGFSAIHTRGEDVYVAGESRILHSRDCIHWETVAESAGAFYFDVFSDGERLFASFENGGLVEAGPAASPSFLSNASARVTASAANAAILGCVLDGGMWPREVLVRSVSSALAQFGVGDTVPQSAFRVHPGDGAVVVRGTPESALANKVLLEDAAARFGAFAMDFGADSALLLGDATELFTVVGGLSASEGTHLVEVYTEGDVVGKGLRNISVRVRIEPVAAPPILGFVITGDQPLDLLLRGVSAGLAEHGLSPVEGLAMSLHDADGRTVFSLPRVDLQPEVIAEVAETVGAFPVATGEDNVGVRVRLHPGAYTLVATAGSAGDVLCEVYVE
jgi:hypothetical protein